MYVLLQDIYYNLNLNIFKHTLSMMYVKSRLLKYV